MSNLAVGAAQTLPDVGQLDRAPFQGRALRNLVLTAGVWVAAVMAAVPLVSVLYLLIVRGGSRLSLEALTALPPAGFEMGGGFGNAIVGTVIMVGIAGLISFFCWCVTFLPSPASPRPYPLMVRARMTVGEPLCSTAAL